MKKYRIKPGEIEAAQYTGTNAKIPGVILRDVEDFVMAFVKTPRGPVSINVGDWVLKTENNEFYVCKSEIFDKVYEPVEEV